MKQTTKEYLDEALAELNQPIFKKVPHHCDTVTGIALITLRQAMLALVKALMAEWMDK